MERSLIYQGFAAAFREPGGGSDILDESIAPPPSPQTEAAFLKAFDTGIHKHAISLHESSHITWDQTALFEDLVRIYDHFGLRRLDTAELPDHICVELEFMHFLTFLEGQHQADAGTVTSLRRAQHDFLERRLLPFTAKLRKGTAEASPAIRQLVEGLCGFLDEEFSALKS